MFSRLLCALLLLLLGSFSLEAKSLKIVAALMPPYVIAEGDQPRGVLVDIATEALKEIGYEPEFSFYPWPRAIEALKRSQAHIILPFFKNPQREEFARFVGGGLVEMELMFFKRRGSFFQIHSMADARSLRIVKVRRANLGSVFDKARSDHIFEVDEAGNTLLAMKMLKAGRVDLMANVKDIVIYSAFRENMSNEFETAGPAFGSFHAYMACSREIVTEDLCNRLGRITDKMKADGRINEIVARYVGLEQKKALYSH